MTPLEMLAKEIGRSLWSGDPERAFTDEAWERGLKWWREAPEIVRDQWFAHKCFRVARASLAALEQIDMSDIAAGITGPTATRVNRADRIEVFQRMLRAVRVEVAGKKAETTNGRQPHHQG